MHFRFWLRSSAACVFGWQTTCALLQVEDNGGGLGSVSFVSGVSHSGSVSNLGRLDWDRACTWCLVEAASATRKRGKKTNASDSSRAGRRTATKNEGMNQHGKELLQKVEAMSMSKQI